MRLSEKLTKYFTIIVFFSMAFGFVIFFFAIERATTQSAIGKLENLNKIVENKLQTQSIEQIVKSHPHVKISVLSDQDINLIDEVIKEGNYEWNDKLQTMVNHVSVITYPFVGKTHYAIQSQISLTIIDNEFFVGIIMVVAWIFVFVIITIIFFGELITRKLYTPFYHLLDEMKRFDVRENYQLQLMDTNISELNDLNQLFVKTSSQTVEHYEALKEFTQNLSHELQTPIANIKGKIELMLNSDLTEDQMFSLSKMYDELNKVSTINRSLVLLMSLDHHEVTDEKINLSELIEEIISDQDDMIAMNGVTVTLNIEANVYAKLNPLLAQIVFSNLISNANRHNIPNGKISIVLNRNLFKISNTGNEQEFTNETIFQRFKKGKHNSESIGIGLALVKKILNLYNFEVEYQFHQDLHIFSIDLSDN
ncbi:sensor histidine kinase [Faecalibacter bovis]|uniref:histidine kinase n=1 Tax=Faecalibacter bovis TaxID=2898187 RepID=A0ABX7XEK8_9FLAO|nr:HAMP domain-containing sensor histidine kinase [Faecalibacter bovis]QTV06281.1 HAMP domain-containing histidine kinase [Faecalibacter bovis]